MKMMKIKNKVLFYVSIISVLILGNVSGLIAASQMDFYKNIKLPFFAPPGIVFAPVWTILYILIGYSFYKLIVDKKTFSHVNNIIYVTGLILNYVWSYVFFTNRDFGFALIILLGIWFITLYFMAFVSKKIPVLIWTQLPYLLWLTFAGGLNLSIILLN